MWFDPQQDPTSDGLVAEDERGAYFSDGLRKIDLVLAYDADDTQSSLKRDGDINDEGGEAEQHRRQHRKAWRDTFEANLINAGETQINRQCHNNLISFGTLSAGLQIERETSSDSGTNFVKIHAPNPIINLNAEVAGLKPTVKEYCVTYYAGEVRPADGLFPKYDHFYFSLLSQQPYPRHTLRVFSWQFFGKL